MNCNCKNNTLPTSHHTEHQPMTAAYIRAAVAAVMLGTGMIADASGAQWISNQWLRLAYYMIAYMPVAVPVIIEAVQAMKERDVFSEFTLMAIATIGAFAIGEYPEAVAVMLFYSVGELFQENAVNKAKRNIGALLDIRPQTTRVIRDGKAHIVTPQSVSIGETIEVMTGERIPSDGTLITETLTVDASALTGESMPRTIAQGEEVLAGMIAIGSTAQISVTRPYNQSALARILQMVQNATERKAPAEQFIRKFARIYTPTVVALAVLIAVLPAAYSLVMPSFHFQASDWIYRALVFLVISCPCALVISIPLGYFGGIGAASRHGILFKGSNYLDAITKINTVVTDKTGTLTKGMFQVQQVAVNGSITPEQLLHVVASAESKSTHPIAKAIVADANRQGIEIEKPEKVTETAGQGLQTIVNQKAVMVGNTRMLDQYNIAFPETIRTIPETVVICAIDQKYAGHIVVADTQKDDASAAIESMRHEGVKKIVLLSGDKQAIVDKLAKELNIEETHGDLLPEDKVQYIEQLKLDTDNRIAFVGDGINDAPALATSHVGIAMGGLGSDMAIETADVVIQTDQPSRIATAIRIGRKTRSIVIQNIVLALGIKLIILSLGAAGHATLWEAVFADVGVALLAILNSVRAFSVRR